MEDNEKIRPITLEIDKELWNKFKSITPRTITLNDKIVELIENEIKTFAR